MSISTAEIVAAGKGKRMGTEISKQFLPLCGKEILAHTVEKFEKAACIRDIILVTGGDALPAGCAADGAGIRLEENYFRNGGRQGEAGFCILWLAAGMSCRIRKLC